MLDWLNPHKSTVGTFASFESSRSQSPAREGQLVGIQRQIVDILLIWH